MKRGRYGLSHSGIDVFVGRMIFMDDGSFSISKTHTEERGTILCNVECKNVELSYMVMGVASQERCACIHVSSYKV